MAFQDSNRIFANLFLKIRQSLALEDILAAVVSEIRPLLACDRLLIYRFEPDWSGTVVAESAGSPDLRICDRVIQDPCFERSWLAPYREGRVSACADIQQSGLRDCYVEFLMGFEVKANLVLPILLSDRGEPLWGLLIAHHCQMPRQWSDSDCQLLKQSADQIAIAIQQSLLRQQTQLAIAASRQFEVRLGESEARFRRLAEQAKDVIYRYRWEPDAQLDYINPAVTELMGYTPGEFYADPDLLFSLVHREDLQQFRQQLQASLEPGVGTASSRLMVLRCKHRDGHVVWVEQRCTPLLNGKGDVVSVDAMVREISDHEVDLSPLDVHQGATLPPQQDWELGRLGSRLVPQFLMESWPLRWEPLSNRSLSRWASASCMVATLVLAAGLREIGGSVASQVLVLCLGLVLSASSGGLEAGLWATVALWLYLLGTLGWGEQPGFAEGTADEWPWQLGFYGLAMGGVAMVVGQIKDRSLLAYQALNRVNETLELRVQERTSTLERTNQQLLEEIEERRRAQAAYQAAELDLQQLNQLLESRVRSRTATLEASERRWRNFIDTVRLLVVGIDLDGRVNYVNPHFLALTGYKAEAVIGRNWFETFVPRHQLSQARQVFQEFLDEGFHAYFQTVILTHGGEEIIVAWNNTLLRDSDGQSQGSLSIGEDITERYAVSRMKDEFISVVSHELRTPLTSIHGALELLDKNVVPLESERGRHVLSIAAENSQRLVRLVNDILQLERLESGKINLNLTLLHSTEVTTRALELMQVLLERANISFVLEDPGLQIWADSDRIIQVLTNLIDNAIKFSDPGSSITLRVEAASSPALPGQPMVLFQVHDEGRGIPTEKLGHIFERFHQVDASDSRRRGGTGLGLAICRSIIHQHGGQIWVNSVLAHGSCFYFLLPTAPLRDGLGAQESVVH